MPPRPLSSLAISDSVGRACSRGPACTAYVGSGFSRTEGESSSNILHRLSNTQPAQPAAMRLHVALHFDRIRPRVLPQRPPDCLADEELFVSEIRLDAVVQQIEIGIALE